MRVNFIYKIGKRRALCSLFIFMSISLFSTAQNSSIVYFNAVQDTLNNLGKQVLNTAAPQAKRELLNSQFKQTLYRSLQHEAAFDCNFDSVKSLVRLVPSDKKMVLLNWEFPNDDGTFVYFGYVMYTHPKTKKKTIVELKDNSENLKRPESQVLKPDNWFGAHYYKMILVKHKRNTYYCLLGADWNNKLSKKKLIDVVSISKDGSIKFGAPIIQYNKVIVNRIIFEYTAAVSMSLRYDDASKMIIFDHLSPIDETLKGQYQFYAPDLSYDAFKFKKGKWIHIENIDARNLK